MLQIWDQHQQVSLRSELRVGGVALQSHNGTTAETLVSSSDSRFTACHGLTCDMGETVKCNCFCV